MSSQLKQARLDSGKTLNQISDDLKIRKHYLIALEEGNFTFLPGEVYIKGYLKLYTNYLKIKDLTYLEQPEDKEDLLINRKNKTLINYKYKKQLVLLSAIILSVITILFPLITKH